MPVKISVSKAKELLENGYVRWTKQEENKDGKSLQSYFGLNTVQMQQLLKRPELKNKRVTDNTVLFEEDEVVEKSNTAPNTISIESNETTQSESLVENLQETIA